MAGLRKKRRIQIVVAGFALLFAAAALIGYAMQDGIQLFRAPAQIAADPPRPGERFRLGGLVKAGSWQKGETHRFVVTDTSAEVAVEYAGIVPDLFREGQGTIVTGTLEDGVFRATEVLAKHDEQYMPKEVADALKEQGVFKGE